MIRAFLKNGFHVGWGEAWCAEPQHGPFVCWGSLRSPQPTGVFWDGF
jgi:hypothetical protein